MSHDGVPDIEPSIGIAIASGALFEAMFDILVAKGAISRNDTQNIIMKAMAAVGIIANINSLDFSKAILANLHSNFVDT
jgi:hypothetical protein